MTVSAPRIPACMDADEYALWERGNGVMNGTRNGARVYTGRAESPCDGCPLGYAADMRAVGRCNGTPGAVEEDEIVDTPASVAASEATEVIGRRRVTTIAPCESCVHARVCRLRPDPELVVKVNLPELATELTVKLTATVECMEYVRARQKSAAENGAPLDRPKRVISTEARERLRLGAAKTQAILAAKRAAEIAG